MANIMAKDKSLAQTAVSLEVNMRMDREDSAGRTSPMEKYGTGPGRMISHTAMAD